MNVNELLDTIEDTLEESAGMPLSGGKRIVDVEQIRDYLDEIRQNLPVELRQAQSIVSDRAQLIESANAQAQAIVKKAEERARVLVSEAEIVKAAQQRAGEIVSAAQTEARTVIICSRPRKRRWRKTPHRSKMSVQTCARAPGNSSDAGM